MNIRNFLSFTVLTLFPIAVFATSPIVEVEEDVVEYSSPNNGAGPLWCYGSSVMVRKGERVFLSINQTGQDVPPLCNTRWRIFERKDQNWETIAIAENFREREPCPLVMLDDALYLSINPSTKPEGTKYGPCAPNLLRFPFAKLSTSQLLNPKWSEGTYFTDHSYRGIAADRKNGEILLLNINAKTSEQFWALRNQTGEWIANGKLSFPIRACYPQVALRNQQSHVMAIGDIIEPVEAWRNYKKEQTGRNWDYVFRRLFYAWSPNVGEVGFHKPIEVENLDSTAGSIRNLDLWLDHNGRAWLLYTKSPVQNTLMRDKFFPDLNLTTSLCCTIIDKGNIVDQMTLAKGGEGLNTPQPHYARFHATQDDTLYVVMFVQDKNDKGETIYENRIQPIYPEAGEATSIPLNEPFRMFFTATERGGSKPSNTLDLYGIANKSNVLRYARIKL